MYDDVPKHIVPFYRSTCVSWHPDLRTGKFCRSKVFQLSLLINGRLQLSHKIGMISRSEPRNFRNSAMEFGKVFHENGGPYTHTHTQPFYCWSGICPGPNHQQMKLLKCQRHKGAILAINHLTVKCRADNKYDTCITINDKQTKFT